MNNPLKCIAHAFNLAAASYNKHARIQREVGDKLIHMITSFQSHFDNVVDAGCGTGLVTEQLAREITYTSFTACDISLASLVEAAILPADIRRMEIDFNELDQVSPHPNLIFANMALHWSTSLADTLSIFHSTLANNGMLAFSIPLIGTFREISNHYSCRDYLTHDQVISLLTNSGFTLLNTCHTTHINCYESTLSALRAIKQTGVSYVTHRLHKSLLGKNHLHQYPVQQLTYITGYFLAMKHHE